MSNLAARPDETTLSPAGCAEALEVLTARAVPLGGPRAMTVNRTLPQRQRSLIGPWCFVDHFGPDDVSITGGMQVPRHPHTGLATVTLLFAGQIEHRDSTGFANTVRPGEVNLMIAGSAISHSEFSTADTTTLHGVQLWFALPDKLRFGPGQSQHAYATAHRLGAGQVRVFLGSLATHTSPIDTRVPALAAEVRVPAGAYVRLAVDAEFEHGVLVDAGSPRLQVVGTAGNASVPAAPSDLVYLAAGAHELEISAVDSAQDVRVLLIGGKPFGESIVMWWNFVGRDHAEIAQFRDAWQREIGAAEVAPTDTTARVTPVNPGDFGPFPDHTPAPLPAPRLPNARLRPRGA